MIKTGSRWVGWYNDSRDGEPVEILFEFDTVREFHAVHLHTNNMFNRGVQVRIIFVHHVHLYVICIILYYQHMGYMYYMYVCLYMDVNVGIDGYILVGNLIEFSN